MSSLLIIIPARGGSKGLPGKNLKAVGGIPLVGRSLKVAFSAARQVDADCRIICSTDDPEIAEAAKTWGASVPFLRPAKLATDTAKSIDVVLHAINSIGSGVDSVVLLQPTSPLVEAGDVVGAIELFEKTGDSVVSVCPNEHPLEWSYSLDADGILVSLMKGSKAHQRQSSTKTYQLNGAVYVASVKQLIEQKTFLGKKIRGYLMPVERSVDIDTIFDLQFAEFVLSNREIPVVEIAGRKIGPGHPCFIIAEAGVNHNGDLDRAIRLVDAAFEAGADAVKFQTFRAERLVTSSAPKANYQHRTTDAKESQLEMIKHLELDEQSHKVLLEHCARRGILFLSTPFDELSADLLVDLGLPAFKISSGDLTNHFFLKHLARKGRPLILSTGMASIVEVEQAVQVVQAAGPVQLILLHCVSNYPADPADVNLRAMATMRAAFGVPVGYSDHTLGISVTLASAALGASVIEKHFTLDRGLPGPDHQASIEPTELAEMVTGVRNVENALGNGRKVPAASEANTREVARKSLVAAKDIKAGTRITKELVASKRPGTGMSPSQLSDILGKIACRAIAADTLLTLEMFQ